MVYRVGRRSLNSPTSFETLDFQRDGERRVRGTHTVHTYKSPYSTTTLSFRELVRNELQKLCDFSCSPILGNEIKVKAAVNAEQSSNCPRAATRIYLLDLPSSPNSINPYRS